ncbi:MAG: nitroreductase family protein, partial [Alistipes sp.]|nr:nitroreductase family protein [Alistipes sp.]
MKNILLKHRSIRKYRSTPIPDRLLAELLEAATRASTCGNMQLYSLVVTRDAALRAALAPCHFNQPMVTQAPCLVTVCADIHRFSMWCRQREAEPAYDNFAWFLNAATDALLAAQNLCIAAEAHSLGICILGTT